MRRLIALAIVVCFIGGPMAVPWNHLAAADNDKPEVKVQILDWAGTQKLIASKKGKIVVLDVWSNSCAPCLEEFPNLVALSKRNNPDIVCMSLNLDYIGLKKKPPEYYQKNVLEFLKEQDARFDNILSSEKDEKMYEHLGIPSIPAVFVYGRDGKIAKVFENSDAKTEADNFTYKDVNAYVETLLKK